MTRIKHDYVDKKKFYEAMVEYNKDPIEERVITEYIGKCILLICQNLANRSNFRGYSAQWKQEMISDAIENCMQNINSFNPDMPQKNPFWYFSRVAFNAFRRRIKIEKRQQYVMHKNMQNYYLDQKVAEVDKNEVSDKIIDDFETYIKRQKEKKK